jgi:D-amino peptidase
VEGLAAAGVGTIDVIDRHGSGCDETTDLPAARLDSRARFVDERAAALFTRITQRSWDAVALVGGHASPGRNGFLEHTGSFGIDRIINGVSVSESEQQATIFGTVGIPIIFASGDDRHGAQLKERLPWVTFVEVKRAISRTAAASRAAPDVRAALVEQVKVAVARRDRARAVVLVPPFTGAYRPVWPNTLEPLKAIPGVDISAGEFRVSGATPRDVNEAINRIANVVNSVGTASAYWEYVGDDARRDRFRDSLFMVRWSEGPPRKP